MYGRVSNEKLTVTREKGDLMKFSPIIQTGLERYLTAETVVHFNEPVLINDYIYIKIFLYSVADNTKCTHFVKFEFIFIVKPGISQM